METILAAVFLVAVSYAADSQPRVLRATGTVQALHSLSIMVPRVSGQQQGNITLTMLIPNGTLVKAGDTVAEFDRIAQAKAARDAAAKFDDLTHQTEQKAAEQRSNAAKRASDLAQAVADLEKARLETRKGPVLSEIDQQKNQEKLKTAEAHVASLKVSNSFHEKAEAAELEVLKLQATRQKMTLERVEADANKLIIKAQIGGMVALQNVFRNNSMGHAQEGDQLWPGQPLLRIFDPNVMVLDLTVSEADGAVLHPGAIASVHLDAYPALALTARFDSASPVAASALGSPLKTFAARFVFEQTDPHLLPDLSAAADLELSPVR
jgi:HlyD family secretion protein